MHKPFVCLLDLHNRTASEEEKRGEFHPLQIFNHVMANNCIEKLG